MEERKKKLMLISPMLHQGGFERVCITTARLLQPYFEVIIVIFDSSNIAYDIKGLDVIDIKMGVQKGKIKKLLNVLKRSRKVKQLKEELHPDISYSFGPSANLVNAFSKTKNTKVWLGLRNYTDVEEKLKVKLFVKLADLIICCSKEIEKEINNRFQFHKTATLYNPYDVETIRKESECGEPELPFGETDEEGRKLRYLVSMGRDDDMKGFWHMLKAFSLIQKNVQEARLLILGAGTFETYKKLAEDLKISDAVYFAGMRKDPYKYLKKGEIYLLTSQNEGFPNALVEGMSLGLAAVSVDCMTGPLEILAEDKKQELVEDQLRKKKTEIVYGTYGILLTEMEKEKNLDASDIQAGEKRLAEVVVDLLRTKERLEKYQHLAKQRANDFTYESYVEQFLKLEQQRIEKE